MSNVMVEVESKIVGGSKDLLGLDTIALELSTNRISVQDLIRRTVEEQISDLLRRRKVDEEQAQSALSRQYLSDSEVDDQARQGAVRMPHRLREKGQISVESEVRKAIQAFEKRVFLVIVDGKQADSLDQILETHEDTRVTFLRLTPLAGG